MFFLTDSVLLSQMKLFSTDNDNFIGCLLLMYLRVYLAYSVMLVSCILAKVNWLVSVNTVIFSLFFSKVLIQHYAGCRFCSDVTADRNSCLVEFSFLSLTVVLEQPYVGLGFKQIAEI